MVNTLEQTAAPLGDIEALEHQISKCAQQIHGLQGQRAQLIDEKFALVDRLDQAYAYLDNKEAVQNALAELQEALHARSKGYFEALLTQLIHDVIPGETGQVVFETRIKNGQHVLDICLSRDGELESIFKDNGGALSNVISMGLRFICLSRSNNRRFLVFDEADAWIKPDNVSRFMRVIDDLGKKLGVQCLVISHHDPEVLGTDFYTVDLVEKNGVVVVKSSEWIEPSSDQAIASIRLKNFKSHVDTQIRLSEGVTLLRGRNNIGKSHFSRALDAMRSGASAARHLRHGTHSLQVDIEFQDGSRVEWSYFKKGKVRQRYEWIVGSEVQWSIEGGKSAPDALSDVLFMDPIHDFDIHVVDQKMPVFMISDQVSGAQRAKLLSLDADQQRAQKMIALHTARCRDAKRDIGSISAQINRIERQIGAMGNVDALVRSLEAQENKMQTLRRKQDYADRLEATRKELEHIIQREQVYDVIHGTEAVQSLSVKRLMELGHSYKELRALTMRLEPYSLLSVLKPLPQAPSAQRLNDLVSAGKSLKSIHTQMELYASLPEGISTNEVSESLKRFEYLSEYTDIRDKEAWLWAQMQSTKQSIKKLTDDKQELLAGLGSCPTCGQRIGNHEHG